MGNYKRQFFQFGFTKWEGSYEAHLKYFPILFLGPFDVSEGPIRQQMYQEINKVQSTKKSLPYLVYWYGEELHTAFSFVPQRDCLSYEEGVARGLHKLPKPMRKKLDKGIQLTNEEEKLCHAQDCMKEDYIKGAGRRLPFKKLREDHELILAGDRLIVEIKVEREADLTKWTV